jgi:hypothetical protein
MPRLPKERILRVPIRNMLMAAPFQVEKKHGVQIGAAYESEAVDSLQAMPVQQSVANWTAASVTVLVQS